MSTIEETPAEIASRVAGMAAELAAGRVRTGRRWRSVFELHRLTGQMLSATPDDRADQQPDPEPDREPGQQSGATTITVFEAAGKMLDELRARFRFTVIHEEDPADTARPLTRVLEFPNLTQAVEFAQMFDPVAHADVWFTNPRLVDTLFDQPVQLTVVFHPAQRPAIVHGVDTMRRRPRP